MRIAHVLSGSPHPDVANGVRQGVHYLSIEQARHGHDIVVFHFSESSRSTFEGVEQRGYPPPAIPFLLPRGFLEDLGRWNADVLHLHQPYYPPNVRIARWARSRSLPYVVTPHGGLSPGELRERWALKLPFKYLCELPILNGAAFVQALSPGEQLERYGVRTPQVSAPNGVHAASIPPELDRDWLARRVPETRDRRTFLYMGRLDPAQKGLDMLVSAAARADLEGVALVLVGPDWRGGRRRLDRRIARARSSTPVILLDAVYGREKFDLMAGADVFVHPSRWEGMPQVVLEASAMGLPALLTAAADPWGRLVECGAARQVEPDVASIAMGLREMACLEDARLDAMGARGRETVRCDFQWDRPASILLEAYGHHAQRGW